MERGELAEEERRRAIFQFPFEKHGTRPFASSCAVFIQSFQPCSTSLFARIVRLFAATPFVMQLGNCVNFFFKRSFKLHEQRPKEAFKSQKGLIS